MDLLNFGSGRVDRGVDNSRLNRIIEENREVTGRFRSLFPNSRDQERAVLIVKYRLPSDMPSGEAQTISGALASRLAGIVNACGDKSKIIMSSSESRRVAILGTRGCFERILENVLVEEIELGNELSTPSFTTPASDQLLDSNATATVDLLDSIDFEEEKKVWQELSAQQREVLTWTIVRFGIGETTGVQVLDPIISALAEQSNQKLSQCYAKIKREEAGHGHIFKGYISRLTDLEPLSEIIKGRYFDAIFGVKLPGLAEAIKSSKGDHKDMIRFCVWYHYIGEGLSGKVGLRGIEQAIDAIQAPGLSGLKEVISRVAADEVRHVALGVEHIRQLVDGNASLKWLVFSEFLKGLVASFRSSSEVFSLHEKFPFKISRIALFREAMKASKEWMSPLNYRS